MIESPPSPYPEEYPQGRLSTAGWALRLHRLKFLIFHYWWIMAVTISIGLGIQAYRCFTAPPRYISAARMMQSGHLSLPQGAVYSEELDNFYGTQVALMKSRDTVNQAVTRVGTIHPEITVDPNATVDAQLQPRTSIFDLSVASSNREYAKVLLDAVMDTYLASKRGRMNQTADDAVSAITEEVSNLDTEIRNDEQQLLDFQKENDVVFIEEQSSSAASYLVSLNNEMARLTKEHDLLALEKDLPAQPASGTDSGGPAPGGETSSSPATQELNASVLLQQENIEKLKIQRDELGVYLKDQHPKMIALSDEIVKEQKFLDVLKTRDAQSRDMHLQDLELQIRNLQSQIADWNKKSLDLSQRLGFYQQIKNKITREQSLYNQMASSIQNVDLNKNLDQEDVRIMEAASPAVLIDPGYPSQLGTGLLGGLLAGLVLIYLVNRLDDHITSPLELKNNIDYPLLGQIPMAKLNKKTKRVPLLSETDDRHDLIEAHRNVRSALYFRSSVVVKPRSLLITSAVPGEGKSTLSSNLAVTFALSGSRVLLIDADLRRGVLHNLFQLPVSPGFSDCLANGVGWRSAVHATKIANLDLLPRGKIVRGVGDLLLGPGVDALLQESVAEYDMVLWDSAPILAADDASNLCGRVDGVLFVVRLRVSSLHAVLSALDELGQREAHIAGIVANAVKADQPGYYNRYRYKDYLVG
jgi:capsular exopolysaccharide synthesis family protein